MPKRRKDRYVMFPPQAGRTAQGDGPAGRGEAGEAN